VVGNAAYEAGNIGGAALGLEAIFGVDYINWYPFVIGLCAFILLYLGNYKVLEKVLVSLVPPESILTIIALVGTTIVPYNLFLHASLVSEKWKSAEDLKAVKRDTYISIALGGLVSMAIIIAATTISGGEVKNVMDLAKGLVCGRCYFRNYSSIGRCLRCK